MTTGEYQVPFPNPDTQFKKGESGNPNGRPVGSVSVKAELQKLMNIILSGEVNPLTEMPEDMPVGRKVALNLVMKAVADGDINAVKQIIENLEGKPAQAINLGGQDGENPLTVEQKVKADVLAEAMKIFKESV